MADLTSMLQASAGAGGAESDDDFASTVLLLHGDGTNGAQNNTFLDSSTNNFTITRNGNTTQGSFSPFSKPDGRWGNYFNGATSDAIQAPNNAVFDYGTGDVTVEFWVYLNSLSAIQNLIDCGPTGGSGFTSWAMDISTSGYVQFVSYLGGTLQLYTATSNPLSTNQWYHIAYTRSSGTNRLFVNGSLCTATGGISQQINSGGNPVTIGRGRYSGFERPTTGYFSNVRITKGGALYTSAFTPSTTPLTTTVGAGTVSLLTCQSNRFVDKSVNAFAITVFATPKVTPFSPFPITTAYDPSVNGGSGYFDGSGDYLTLPSGAAFQFGTGDFSVECWFYVGATSTQYLVDARNSGQTNTWAFHVTPSTGNIVWFNGSTDWTVNTTLRINSWNHIAYVRETTTGSMFLNGSRLSTQTDSTNYSVSPTISTVGARNTNVENINGYLANVRVVKGTAVYSGTTYTVPTTPLTAISNTSLLLNFTNAGIYDTTGFNNLETVGNAQIDTTTKKYGTGSLEFDGTTDYVVQPTSENFGYSTGDFTIEFWCYFNDVTTSRTIVSNLSGAASVNPHLYIFNGTLRYYTASADRITSSSLSTGQWYHIAVARSGSSTKMFIDGSQAGSTYTDTNNYLATAPLGVGTYWSGGNPVTSNTFNGYIDDLRITKGVARYTTTFTPPTKAFPNIGS